MLGRGVNVVQRRNVAGVDTANANDLSTSDRTDQGAATRTHGATVTGTRQTRPPTTVTFPRDKAKKSPY